MTKANRLSRRALLATAAVSRAAAGQRAPAEEAPASEIEVAQRQRQTDYEQMRKIALPRAVEPATVFRP
jgi:hypothetical protein